MALRFQTYFGVPIPPFKEKKIGAGASTIRFVITGKIPSKKNHLQSISVRKGAKDFLYGKKNSGQNISFSDAIEAVNLVSSKVRPNEEYRDFVDRCKPIIQEQMLTWSNRLYSKGLVFPLQKAAMNLRLYFKARHITDTVNKQQSIQDLLIECGVLANDDYNTLNPIHSESACYYEELIHDIAFISLSFKL